MNVYLFVLMIINMKLIQLKKEKKFLTLISRSKIILHNNLENMKKIKLKIKSNTI